MPLPVIAGVVRCAFNGTVPSGQPWVNVWHAQYTAGASSPGPSDIVALDAILVRFYLGTAFPSGSAWLTACTAGVTLIQATYTPLDGTSLSTQIAHAGAGSQVGTSTPAQTAQVLTLRTGVRGRQNRGRIYLPCPATNQMVTNGDLQAASIALALGQINGVQSALGGTTTAPFWRIGVASYVGHHFSVCTNFTMDAHPDVQRRRRM